MKAKKEGSPKGEVSLFHGGYSCVAKLQNCDSHHSSTSTQFDFSSFDFVYGETMVAELE